jgi:LPS-assembly protein
MTPQLPIPQTVAVLRLSAIALAWLPVLGIAQERTWLAGSVDDKAPTEVQAEKIVGRPDRDVTMEQGVEIIRGKTLIQADRMHYDMVDDKVEAEGNVRVAKDGNVFTGKQLRLKLDTGEGVMQSPIYKLIRKNAHGKADRIDFQSQDLATVIGGYYTTCSQPEPDWYLRTGSLTLDNGREIGVAKDAVLVFKGVPLAGTPHISFPLSDERVSGFLAPTIATSTSGGLEVTTPYYWNIAPNRDVILAPHFITRRGLMLGGTARYMGEQYSGQTRFEVIDRDAQTNESRYAIASRHKEDLGSGLTFTSNLNMASDNNYARDFPFSHVWAYQPGVSRRVLPRDVRVDYGSQDSNASARLIEYQILQDPSRNAKILMPYSRLPQLRYSYFGDNQGSFSWSVASEFTRFYNSTVPVVGMPRQGDRMVLNPRLTYNYSSGGFFIRPSVSAHQTLYSLDETADPAMKAPSRFIPTLSVDSGLIFERDTTMFGNAAVQTLEPRLFYTHTPYKRQDSLLYPNFDSSEADFNYATVFRENRFVGNDRIGDSNQLTSALMTRYLESNGVERVRLAVAQRFSFTEQRVSLDQSITASSETRSDLLFLGSGRVTDQLRLDSNFQYSQTRTELNRMNVGAFWQPAPMKVLNVQYRRDVRNLPNDPNSNFELIDISSQWPIGDRWYGVGRLSYLLKESKMGQSLAGLEYKADCWIFRMVGQKVPTAQGVSNTMVFLQLEFNGLSMLGANPMKALRANVPGYQPLGQTDYPYETY